MVILVGNFGTSTPDCMEINYILFFCNITRSTHTSDRRYIALRKQLSGVCLYNDQIYHDMENVVASHGSAEIVKQ